MLHYLNFIFIFYMEICIVIATISCFSFLREKKALLSVGGGVVLFRLVLVWLFLLSSSSSEWCYLYIRVYVCDIGSRIFV